jgi:hypothetical protein
VSTAAVFSSIEAQRCVMTAVREVLGRLHPEVTARWLECSTDTIERMVHGAEAEARWTTARTCRLIACERSVLGTTRLSDALGSTFAFLPPPVPKSVTSEIGSGIGALTDLVRDECVAVADGVVSDAELARIASDIPKAIDHLTRMSAAVAARRNRSRP